MKNRPSSKGRDLLFGVLLSGSASLSCFAGDERMLQERNDAIANAYKLAVVEFLGELRQRAGQAEGDAGEFMSSFESYQSEAVSKDDHLCIVFTPKLFKSSPVLGGVVSYCFDASGLSLVETIEER